MHQLWCQTARTIVSHAFNAFNAFNAARCPPSPQNKPDGGGRGKNQALELLAAISKLVFDDQCEVSQQILAPQPIRDDAVKERVDDAGVPLVVLALVLQVLLDLLIGVASLCKCLFQLFKVHRPNLQQTSGLTPAPKFNPEYSKPSALVRQLKAARRM